MKIHVKADGHTIFVPIPSCLLFNALSAYLVYKFAAPHIDAISGLTYEQTRKLMHGINRARHRLSGSPLVDVESSGGKVLIYL